MREDIKDTLERAFHTFWQTALVFALATNDWSDWKVVLAGATGAGLSASKTLLQKAVKEYRNR